MIFSTTPTAVLKGVDGSWKVGNTWYNIINYVPPSGNIGNQVRIRTDIRFDTEDQANIHDVYINHSMLPLTAFSELHITFWANGSVGIGAYYTATGLFLPTVTLCTYTSNSIPYIAIVIEGNNMPLNNFNLSYSSKLGRSDPPSWTVDTQTSETLLTGSNTTKAIFVNLATISDGTTQYPLDNIELNSEWIGSVNINGDTMLGKLIAQNNTDYSTYQVRNISLSSTASVSTGNGSILGVYS